PSPAGACPEHVAERESAADDESAEVVQAVPSREQVGHVHVEALEAGTVEGRGDLGLAVHALLAQDRDARTRAARDEGRGDVLAGIEAQRDVQAGIVLVADALELLGNALRVVAHRRDPSARLAPEALQRRTRL